MGDAWCPIDRERGTRTTSLPPFFSILRVSSPPCFESQTLKSQETKSPCLRTRRSRKRKETHTTPGGDEHATAASDTPISAYPVNIDNYPSHGAGPRITYPYPYRTRQDGMQPARHFRRPPQSCHAAKHGQSRNKSPICLTERIPPPLFRLCKLRVWNKLDSLDTQVAPDPR